MAPKAEMVKAGSAGNWLSWIEEVPQDVRDEIAEIVVTSDVTTSDGLVKMSKLLVTEFVKGRIEPSVMAELRAWAGFMFSAILAAKPQSSINILAEIANISAGTPRRLESKLHIDVIEAAKPEREAILIDRKKA